MAAPQVGHTGAGASEDIDHTVTAGKPRSFVLSRSAVGTAIGELERWRIVERIRLPGERADHVRMVPDYATQSLESADEYAGLAAICRQGLQAIAGSTPERKARLEGMIAFAEFLVERMPQLAAEWRERRKSLRPGREDTS